MPIAPTLTLAVATLRSDLASERKVCAVQRLVSALTLTLLLATPSRAGWVSHGPEGGTVTVTIFRSGQVLDLSGKLP